MPNLNQPFGFRPARPLYGGIERTNGYIIAAAYAANLAYGQPVKLSGTDRTIVAALGTAEPILGIFAGCTYDPLANDEHPKFAKNWPASTAVKTGSTVEALVWDDPDELFVCQADGTLAATDCGLNYGFNVGTPSFTGFSTSSLAVASKDTTAQVFQALELLKEPGNAWGAYPKLLVRISNHQLRLTTGL